MGISLCPVVVLPTIGVRVAVMGKQRCRIAKRGQGSNRRGSRPAARASALRAAASAAHQQPARVRQSRRKSEQKAALADRQEPSGNSEGMDGCVLAVQRAMSAVVAVAAQARLRRCRYPMAGRFTAGRRARRRSASGLASTSGEGAHWPHRGCADSCRDVRLVEGACAVSGQC